MIFKIFRSLFIFCLSIIIGVFFSFSVLLMVPFLICRLLVSFLSVLRPDLDGILKLCDGPYLTRNFWKHPKLVILAKFVVKGRMSADYVKEQFANKIFDKDLNMRPIQGFSVLQQYPYSWMGYFFWKREDNFNIDNHVREYSCGKLKDNPNYVFSEKELKEIEDGIYEKPFLKHKSLWDMTLVPKGISDSGQEETLMYFRSNHSMGDGYAMTLLCAKLFGDENSAKLIEENEKLGNISWKLKFAILIKTVVFGFDDMAETMLKVRVGKLWNVLYPKNSNKLVYFESKQIPMEKVKEVSKIYHICVSAVIYSAIAAGLRKALMKNRGSIPKTMAASLVLPVCDRPIGLANHVTGDLITLPVGESDSVKRLKIIHNNICRARNSTLQFFALLFPVFGAPFSFITQLYSNPIYSPPVAVITSIPTFKTKLCPDYEFQTFSYATTAGIVNINTPFGLTSLSYNDQLQFVAMGHKAVFTVQDLEEMAHVIEEELENFKSLPPLSP